MTAETTGHPIRQTGTESRRDPAIDALRGLALMGILIVNLPFFAMPYGFAGSWWKQADAFHLGTATAFLIQALFENKFILIFAFLFGMGAAGQITGSGRRRFMLRMLVLALLGLIDAVLVFEADILLPYALIGLLLMPVQNWSTRAILGLAALLWAISVINHGLYGIYLASVPPNPGLSQEARIALFRDGDLMSIAGQRLRDWLSFSRMSLILLMPLTASAFCLGIAAFRSRMLSAAAHRAVLRDAARLLLWPALIGNAVYGALCLAPADWASGYTFLVALVLRPVFAPLLSLVILANLLALFGKARAGGWRDLFAAGGRMSLSLYLLQGVVSSLLFFGYGFGLFATLGLPAVFLLSLVLFGILALLAVAWSNRFGSGPLEILLARFLTATARPRRDESAASSTGQEAGPMPG